MRKEKLSYVILLAEIVAIVWLHSVKQSDSKEVASSDIVKAKSTLPPAAPSVKYIHTVNR